MSSRHNAFSLLFQAKAISNTGVEGIEHSRGRYLVLFGSLFHCTGILEIVAESQHLFSGCFKRMKYIFLEQDICVVF